MHSMRSRLLAILFLVSGCVLSQAQVVNVNLMFPSDPPSNPFIWDMEAGLIALASNQNNSLLLRKISHSGQLSIVNRHELSNGKKNSLKFNMNYQTGTNKTETTSASYLSSWSMTTSYSLEVVDKLLSL